MMPEDRSLFHHATLRVLALAAENLWSAKNSGLVAIAMSGPPRIVESTLNVPPAERLKTR
jgi:hypothetical protein